MLELWVLASWDVPQVELFFGVVRVLLLRIYLAVAILCVLIAAYSCVSGRTIPSLTDSDSSAAWERVAVRTRTRLGWSVPHYIYRRRAPIDVSGRGGENSSNSRR